jgi:hypothetical protein
VSLQNSDAAQASLRKPWSICAALEVFWAAVCRNLEDLRDKVVIFIVGIRLND